VRHGKWVSARKYKNIRMLSNDAASGKRSIKRRGMARAVGMT
jgi:hypothetical protein